MTGRAWTLPAFALIDITYTTRDRFTDNLRLMDPDQAFMQTILGEIVGVEFDDTRMPLGTIELEA